VEEWDVEQDIKADLEKVEWVLTNGGVEGLKHFCLGLMVKTEDPPKRPVHVSVRGLGCSHTGLAKLGLVESGTEVVCGQCGGKFMAIDRKRPDVQPYIPSPLNVPLKSCPHDKLTGWEPKFDGEEVTCPDCDAVYESMWKGPKLLWKKTKVEKDHICLLPPEGKHEIYDIEGCKDDACEARWRLYPEGPSGKWKRIDA
jgi:hypothetical protein